MDRFESAWWSRLSDGGIRRVWASRSGQRLCCAREEYALEQEAARRRLSRLDYRRDTDGRVLEGELLLDARLLADVRCVEFQTTDVRLAFDFLGGDAAARQALISADPALETRLPAPPVSSPDSGPTRPDD